MMEVIEQSRRYATQLRERLRQLNTANVHKKNQLLGLLNFWIDTTNEWYASYPENLKHFDGVIKSTEDFLISHVNTKGE